jgi:hypothetical protein
MRVISRGRIWLGRHPVSRSTRRTIAEAAIVIAAIVIGIVIGASLERSNTTTNDPAPLPTGSVPKLAPQTGIVTSAMPSTLAALSKALGRPVYWNGPRPQDKYELTLSSTSQRVYLRYLPPGVPLGSPRAAYLSVGTYAVNNAAAALRTQARRPGGVGLQLPHGAVGFYSLAKPTSVYLAYPGTNEQVEVYDPDPAVALRTAESGSITPVR